LNQEYKIILENIKDKNSKIEQLDNSLKATEGRIPNKTDELNTFQLDITKIDNQISIEINK